MTSASTRSPAAGATGELRALGPPARLWVPCGIEPRPVGIALGPGELLSADIPTTEPAALCPARGRILGGDRVRLLGDREVPAIAVESEIDAPESAGPTFDIDRVTTAFATVPPGDLGGGIDRLRAAGVWARRWSSPDLIRQLYQAVRKPIDTILCGGIDLDSELPVQQTVAAKYAVEVTTGVAALARMTGAGRTLMALAEDTPTALLQGIQKAADAARVRLVAVRNEYPLAHPSLLIRDLLGRRLAPDRLPNEARVILLDAAAAFAVGRCILGELPMLRVPFGVYDRTAAKAHLLQVHVGTRLADVLSALQLQIDTGRHLSGHLLRNLPAQADDVIAATELTVIYTSPEEHDSPDACIRCGWCVEACPTRIHPAGLLDAAQQEDPELAHDYGLSSCIDCGICSYVCPSRLPLLESIRGLRNGKAMT